MSIRSLLKQYGNTVARVAAGIPAIRRLYHALRRSKIATAHVYQNRLKGLFGIEIGGPSAFFCNNIPLYRLVGGLDCVNFADQTVWEGSISSGRTFAFDGNRTGTQYIAEASDLSPIPTNSYDFVISSNCLEHVANPLKAVGEWIRIAKPHSYILIVVPDKKWTFDHQRPTTLFDHLLEDYTNGVGEDDMTHFDEIVRLHDLSRDPPAGTLEDFRKRSLDNIHNRCLHHHVFDVPLMRKVLEYFGVTVLQADACAKNVVVLGKIDKAGS